MYTLMYLPYLAGMQCPKYFATQITKTAPKSYCHFRSNTHHQLRLSMVPHSILDMISYDRGWYSSGMCNVVGIMPLAMWCCRILNCEEEDDDPVKLYMLFHLKLLSHYIKGLEYLTFGWTLIYIIYLNI